MPNHAAKSQAASSAADASDREILITRVLNAGRELVYRAFTDPDHVTRWWAPDGFTTTTDQMEVRPDGIWRYAMRGPSGQEFRHLVTYHEVVPGERLVYTHREDQPGAESVGAHTTLTFEAENGDPARTKLTMRIVLPPAAAGEPAGRKYGAVEGAMQAVGRVSGYLSGATGVKSNRLIVALPSPTGIILRRVFEAPRELVFEACSKPEHVRQWWGPRGRPMIECEMDFRVGGKWRFVLQGPDGGRVTFRGEYKEIVPPERVVQTFVYDVDVARDHPSTETMTLVERDGTTILTTQVVHDSQASRDAHLSSGMEPGASETMDRLEELLASLAGKVGA